MTAPDKEQAFLEALESVGTKTTTPPKFEETVILEEGSTDHPVTTADVPSPEAVTPKNIWRHPDAHPIALDLFLVRRYQHKWLDWEPETLQVLIPEDFKTPSISDLNLSKIQACKALHLVDTFWTSWEVFIACLMPFNGEFPDFDVMYAPTVAQVLVAVDVASRIRNDVEWSSEMKAYIQAVYEHDGIFLPLAPADFVTLNVPEEIDQKALAARWDEVRSSERAPTGDTTMDEQLRRLLGAQGFLEESRTRMHRQLEFHV